MQCLYLYLYVADKPQLSSSYIAEKMKFYITDFFSKCEQIHSLMWIWSYLLNKFLLENFIFCAVLILLF